MIWHNSPPCLRGLNLTDVYEWMLFWRQYVSQLSDQLRWWAELAFQGLGSFWFLSILIEIKQNVKHVRAIWWIKQLTSPGFLSIR